MTIQISEYSEFFIAICKAEDEIHTYLIAGVKNGDEVSILAALGKGTQGIICDAIFSKLAASLGAEAYMFDDEKVQFKYKAFAMQYKDYIEFLAYLKLLQTENENGSFLLKPSFRAYCPNKNNPHQLELCKIHKYDFGSDVKPQLDCKQRESYSYLSPGNTCRHTAITLAKQGTKRDDLGTGVSTIGTVELPLYAEFNYGKSFAPGFCILPQPPTALKNIAKPKLDILTKFYRRMDEIILSQQKNPLTMQKFEIVKQLYNQMTKNIQRPLIQLLEGIQLWELNNRGLINKHRKQHWFSFQTATRKMVNDINDNIISPRP